MHKLEAVSPGLATREAIEQSSCFVFKDGRVMTFNDEVACSIDCELGFDGAVAAKPLRSAVWALEAESSGPPTASAAMARVLATPAPRGTMTVRTALSRICVESPPDGMHGASAAFPRR